MRYVRRAYPPNLPSHPESEASFVVRNPDPKRLRLRMVRDQLEARGITDKNVLQAMASVPRHLFVPEAFAAHAYDDRPLPIGYGQTISQPYIVGYMTQLLNITKGLRILEIGAGCGYQAAILAAMGCIVYGVERLEPLYEETSQRLRSMGYRGIFMNQGDGTLGLPYAAPFDRIIVSAGGPQIPPPLLQQLAEKGVMIIPVGTQQRSQRLLRIRKVLGAIRTDDMGPAMFVDLVGNHGWRQ